MEKRKYCDECSSLYPKEWDQSDTKEPHICRKTTLQVHHLNEHPKLPRPDWCPLQANEIQSLQAEKKELRDALKELCILKMMKDADGKTIEYLKRQPEAWLTANKLC